MAVVSSGGVSAVRREEVSLSAAQSVYLANEATTGVLARRAIGAAAVTPFVVGLVLWGITKLVARVPLIGWILGIYGIAATILGVVAGALVIPLVFLVVLPLTLSTRRKKLRQDIELGRAVKLAGSFKVKDDGAAGGKITSDGTEISLSKEQVEALRPALSGEGEDLSLNGSIVHTPNLRLLLAAQDSAGTELTRAA